MNIKLIGTGAIYTKYNSACTLINDDMLVDVPNGVLKQLLNSNNQPEKIEKILITHILVHQPQVILGQVIQIIPI